MSGFPSEISDGYDRFSANLGDLGSCSKSRDNIIRSCSPSPNELEDQPTDDGCSDYVLDMDHPNLYIFFLASPFSGCIYSLTD